MVIGQPRNISGLADNHCGPGGSRTLCLLIANEVFKPGKLRALIYLLTLRVLFQFPPGGQSKG